MMAMQRLAVLASSLIQIVIAMGSTAAVSGIGRLY